MPFTPVSLNTLSLDIVLEILGLLKPVEIINVRKTCKSLYFDTLRRIIWIQALATLVQEHDIYANTYDVDSMSDAQLERAVMFPVRLLELSKKDSGSSIKPKLHRVLVNDAHKDEKMALNESQIDGDSSRFLGFSRMAMVPGGRFLLTTSKQDNGEKSYVQLWDLGVPGRGDTGTRRLSTLTLLGDINLAGLAPTRDGSGITFVVDLESSSRISVYEIYPLLSTPLFNEIATTEMFPLGRCIIAPDNRIFCVSHIDYDDDFWELEPIQIFIWDYVGKMSTTLCIDASLGFSFYPYGDYIVTTSEGSILKMYDIPLLEAKQPIYDGEPFDPLWSGDVSYCSPKPNPYGHTVDHYPLPHQLTWMRNPYDTIPLCVRRHEFGSRVSDILAFAIERSWIPVDIDGPSDVPPAVTASVLATLNHPHTNHIYMCNPIQRCNNQLVLSFELNKNLVLVVAPTPGSGSDECKMGETISLPGKQCILDMGGFEWVDLRFCAVTGRVCAMGENGEIRILDYIV